MQNCNNSKVEERYANLLANTSEMMWCIEFEEPVCLDLPEMEQVERIFRARVVEANEAFARAYGATCEEALTWRVEDFFPRSFPTSVPFLLDAVRSKYRMENAETTEQATDGKTKVFVNSFIGTIQDGRVLRVWGMCRDVTQTREVEHELRLRQEAIDSTEDGFIIADATQPDFPLVYADQSFQDLTGYSEGEIVGRNCRFLQGADTDANTVREIREALAGAKPFKGEILNYRKDGSWFWNFLRITPVRDATGVLTHFVGLQTDITDRKRREKDFLQQREELAHVSRAATLVEIGAALAHELNQPLAAILRNAQAAQRYLDAPSPNLAEVREILVDIVKDNRRAGKVLSWIREQLTGDGGVRAIVHMNQVVEDALTLLQSELIIHNIRIKVQLADALPSITADAIQLQQVMLNLILNAKDAMSDMPGDQPAIAVSTAVVDGMVQVTVSDSGPGIADSELERIFEPFHTTKQQGMGVGLSINRTIVESHDGKIWADNRPEGGAKMVFTIPAASSEPDLGDR